MHRRGNQPVIELYEPLRLVLRVTAEQLVGAFAGEHHLDLAAGGAGQQKNRNVGRFRHRRAAMTNRVLPMVEEFFRGHHQRVVVGPIPFGDLPGEGQLGKRRFFEAD